MIASEETTVAQVFEKAVDTFGNIDKASGWFDTANWALQGAKPIDLFYSDEGRKKVLTILGRIDYGLYS